MKKVIAVLLAFSMFSMLVASGTTVSATEKPSNEKIIRVSENTTVTIDVKDMEPLLAQGYTVAEIETELIAAVKSDMTAKGLSLSNDTEIAARSNSRAIGDYPPGTQSQRFTGSNIGRVWAGIPALGFDPYIEIGYEYDFTRYEHVLYQYRSIEIHDGSRVIGSAMTGTAIGSWDHLLGSITYSTSYGHCLKVSAIGVLTYSIAVTISGVTIPANTGSRQTFAYYHNAF